VRVVFENPLGEGFQRVDRDDRNVERAGEIATEPDGGEARGEPSTPATSAVSVPAPLGTTASGTDVCWMR
jgi:hypothetical protein